MLERKINKWILFNKNGVLGFILAFGICIPLRSADAPEETKASEIKSWSGMRMITLGTRYMTEVPALASEWILKNKEELVSSGGEMLKQDQQIVKVAKSVADGMRNVGKMLVLIGAAKEYTDYFEYKNNPENPLNNSKKNTPEVIAEKQKARLLYLQVALNFLQEELKKQEISVDWLAKLFESNSNGTLTAKSLQFGLGQVGSVMEFMHVYGVGVQISSDLPLGALLATVFSKWLPSKVESAAERFSIEDSLGILYYMKRKETVDAHVPDSIYNKESAKILADFQQRENYRFAARTYEQGGAQVDGVSYARGEKNKSMELGVTVRLTLIASTEYLRNFDIMSLNKAQVAELSMENNISRVLGDQGAGIARSAQGKIQQTIDKSKHFEFLTSNIQIAAAKIFASVDEESGVAAEVPNMMLRLSLGGFTVAPSDNKQGNKLFSLKGSLGSITIDAIEK